MTQNNDPTQVSLQTFNCMNCGGDLTSDDLVDVPVPGDTSVPGDTYAIDVPPNQPSQTNRNNFFKCSYCSLENWIIEPTPLKYGGIVESLDKIERQKFGHLARIVETAYEAEKYSEAYNFCNKALAVESKSPEIWTRKALCSFWIILQSYGGQKALVETNALEIRTFLNQAKSFDATNEFYIESADKIAFNLTTILYWKLDEIGPDIRRLTNPGSKNPIYVKEYSAEQLLKIRKLLRTMETCHEIAATKDFNRLYFINSHYTGAKNVIWARKDDRDKVVRSTACFLAKVNPIKEVERITNIIRQFDPEYSPPPWPSFPKKVVSTINYQLILMVALCTLALAMCAQNM